MAIDGGGLSFRPFSFWRAPPGVRSAIRRHQSPQRAVLSQVNCFIQCEVVSSQIALDGAIQLVKSSRNAATEINM